MIVALAVAAPTAASVTKVSFTSTVKAGDEASLSVSVSPAARCTIAVVYSSGRSEARGLGPRKGTKLTWSWSVGGGTKPGKWPVTVDCGKSGKLALRLTVRR